MLQPLPIGVSSVFVQSNQNPDELLRWTPQGLVHLGVDLPNEKLRTYSVYGVRGSKKYPFGKAWPDYLEIEGWDIGNQNYLYPILLVTCVLLLI